MLFFKQTRLEDALRVLERQGQQEEPQGKPFGRHCGQCHCCRAWLLGVSSCARLAGRCTEKRDGHLGSLERKKPGCWARGPSDVGTYTGRVIHMSCQGVRKIR